MTIWQLARSVTLSRTEIESKSKGEVVINVNKNGERVGQRGAQQSEVDT